MPTVAVQRGLEDIKSYLEENGYDAVYTDDVAGPVIAYVYLENEYRPVYNKLNSMLENRFTGAVNGNTQGVLLINAKGKQPEDILQILSNRTYTPLF